MNTLVIKQTILLVKSRMKDDIYLDHFHVIITNLWFQIGSLRIKPNGSQIFVEMLNVK